MKYLLDTNVLSEIRKAHGNNEVKTFVSSLREEDIFISVISIGEISFGLEKLPDEPKRTELNIWLAKDLQERFGNRIIPLDIHIMSEWGRLRARTGRTLAVIDSLIAATALAHRLVLVTRNTRDFQSIEGIELYNPWNSSSS